MLSDARPAKGRPRLDSASTIRHADAVTLRIEKDGHAITTLDEWFEHAPPRQGRLQWQDGLSALELARSFLESGVPAAPRELGDLLASSLGPVELTVGYANLEIPLDDSPGGTRNADLALLGTNREGRVTVNVEAKTDESFGTTVAGALAAGRANPRSRMTERVSKLALALFGHERREIHALRYQLLYVTAASLVFARQQAAKAAVLVVLELLGPACVADDVSRNRQDLDAFLRMLAPGTGPLVPGTLAGPFTVPGGDRVPKDIPLFVGKATRNLPGPA
jgi:hypothetical protein